MVAAGTLPVYLLFYARYSQWEGGYCFGPRYMVPALALLALALGPMIAGGGKRVRTAAVSLMGIGAAVQLVGIATSFLESQAARGQYYDQHWSYRLSYSLWSQVQVLVKYLGSSRPAPLGMGFDRWFVFLAKAGVSGTTLAVLGGLMILGTILTAIKLRRFPLDSRSH